MHTRTMARAKRLQVPLPCLCSMLQHYKTLPQKVVQPAPGNQHTVTGTRHVRSGRGSHYTATTPSRQTRVQPYDQTRNKHAHKMPTDGFDPTPSSQPDVMYKPSASADGCHRRRPDTRRSAKAGAHGVITRAESLKTGKAGRHIPCLKSTARRRAQRARCCAPCPLTSTAVASAASTASRTVMRAMASSALNVLSCFYSQRNLWQTISACLWLSKTLFYSAAGIT